MNRRRRYKAKRRRRGLDRTSLAITEMYLLGALHRINALPWWERDLFEGMMGWKPDLTLGRSPRQQAAWAGFYRQTYSTSLAEGA